MITPTHTYIHILQYFIKFQQNDNKFKKYVHMLYAFYLSLTLK